MHIFMIVQQPVKSSIMTAKQKLQLMRQPVKASFIYLILICLTVKAYIMTHHRLLKASIMNHLLPTVYSFIMIIISLCLQQMCQPMMPLILAHHLCPCLHILCQAMDQCRYVYTYPMICVRRMLQMCESTTKDRCR